jgi:hypothetical protein
MGIFDSIKSAIFGSAKATEASQSQAGSPGATTTAAATRPAAADAGAAAGASAAAPMSQVDVEAVLTKLAAKKKQKLDWRKSIVDLMKLLDLDSSLAARKQLAKELNYNGDANDSAAMNIWLHKQVMNKLAASGGKVPDDLRT